MLTRLDMHAIMLCIMIECNSDFKFVLERSNLPVKTTSLA